MNPRIDTNPITVEDTAWAVVTDIADQWRHTWNAADHIGYGELFLADVDYVTIYATHVTGRDALAEAAAFVFSTVYRDSTMTNRIVGVRCPAPNVIVAQIELVLDVPSGPLAGTNTMLATAVIVDMSDGWQVATVQETLVVPHDPPPAG